MASLRQPDGKFVSPTGQSRRRPRQHRGSPAPQPVGPPPCGCWCDCVERVNSSGAACARCKDGEHKENRRG